MFVEAWWITKRRDHFTLRKKSYRIINVSLDEIMKDIGKDPTGDE